MGLINTNVSKRKNRRLHGKFASTLHGQWGTIISAHDHNDLVGVETGQHHLAFEAANHESVDHTSTVPPTQMAIPLSPKAERHFTLVASPTPITI